VAHLCRKDAQNDKAMTAPTLAERQGLKSRRRGLNVHYNEAAQIRNAIATVENILIGPQNSFL